MIDIILIVITLIALIIATISDIKTHEIPNYLSYSLIFIALAIKLSHSILTSNYNYFLYALIGLGAMYLFGTALYYTKQWGGGDTKLLMGLGVVFSTTPAFLIQTKIPFLLIILVNIIIVGAIYGLLTGIYLILKNLKKFLKEFKKILKLKCKIVISSLIISGILLITLVFIKDDRFKLFLTATILLINLYIYLWAGIRAVENVAMYKLLPVKKLREGDWVVNKIKKDKKIIYIPTVHGITKKDIKNLIKYKIKKVLVKEGIAFIPAFLIAVIITLIKPEIFLFFL